jgi:signal transduction histidine kinase
MAASAPLPAPRAWLRLSPRTARLRLTLLYAGSFLVLGTAVIAVIYLLASRGPTVTVTTAGPVRALVRPTSASSPGQTNATTPAQTNQAQVAAVPTGANGPLLKAIKGGVVRQHSADSSNLLEVSWLVLAVTAAAAALLGWFASGRVLRPLREMTDTARTISAGNLSERLALTGPDDEFKHLGDTLDDLLARLEASFESQRRFVANASHELRTPLTLERTLLQVALADPNATVASLRATCRELLDSGRDQEQLLEALLTLASSERALDRREPLDLAQLADEALAAPRPEIEDRGLHLDSDLAPAPMDGDPALVSRLIANLLDNAVRYNDPGGRVGVRTATRNGHAWVSVSSTGPTVGPDQVTQMFEPFHRLNGRTQTGDGHHGLGLSIVSAIASAHGAAISAEPEALGGLAVTVSFPARAETAS